MAPSKLGRCVSAQILRKVEFNSMHRERATVPDRVVPIDSFQIIEGIEPLFTVGEVANLLRWSYDSARRYFKDKPGVMVKFQPQRYKRPYRHYMIPKSILQREWQKMASVNDVNNRKAA